MQNIAPDTVIDGRYRVRDRIGSGGMADVYCATDEQLGRTVAVKLLHRRYAEDEEFVERFRREASAAAGLQHPNVVAVFDRGEWDGTYYIAMEYLEGRSVKDIVRDRGPLPPEEAVRLTVQVLKAARFAHRRGIVHRDFKPHNVLVDSENRAKVTDFGIARAGASDMTETGSIMGTAQYISPEQAQGHAVGAASDLYSIGIMLYELLCGRVPFEADSPVTIALKQVSEEPIPPRALNPAVTPELEAVVMHALRKDPARRFGDADAFIEALAAATVSSQGGQTTVMQTTGSYPAAALAAELESGDPRVALEPSDDRTGRRIGYALLLAVLVGAIALGAYLALRPELVPVPNVVRNSQVVATTQLQNAGFRVDVQRARSETVPVDRVFRQEPAFGEDAEEGSTVTLLVSDGPGDGRVPAVEGLTERSARGRLERAGFRPQVRREESSSVRSGRVIESAPPEGSQLQRGQLVQLVVSKGPEQVEVPDVVGDSRDEAESTLEAAGFEVTVSEQVSDAEEPGTVLAQDPAADGEVDEGSTVTLTVAREPETAEVPDVTGRSFDAAAAALRDAGFEPRRRLVDVETPEEDDRVIEQNPPADAERRPGATVFLQVGRFAPPAEPTPSPTSTPDAP